MAKTLALVDNSAAVTLDLLAGTYKLAPGGWRTAFPSARNTQSPSRFGLTQTFERYDPVTETIDLVARGADATVLTAEQIIENFRENIRLWHSDKLQTKSVWLHAYSAGESAKRSLLYDLKLEHLAEGQFTPLLGKTAVKARLALVRHPFWEDTTTTTLTLAGGSVNMLGGTKTFTAAYAGGTAPGRFNAFTLTNAGGGGTLDKVWVGIRETYGGTANFISLWECELGTAGTDTSVVAAVGTASADSKMQCTFATTTLVKRVSITRANVYATADDNDFTGRYLVLLRCQLDAAGSVGIQLKYGYTGASNFAQCEEKQPITNTSYQLIELGEIQLPPIPPNLARTENISALDMWKNFEIQLFAERLSGTPKLDMDALVLIPADHMLYGEGLNFIAGSYVNLITLENDEQSLFTYVSATGQIGNALNYTARDFYLPVGGGVIVMAGQGTSAQVLTDTTGLIVAFYRRWQTLRGS